MLVLVNARHELGDRVESAATVRTVRKREVSTTPLLTCAPPICKVFRLEGFRGFGSVLTAGLGEVKRKAHPLRRRVRV